jgi:hypothetical protein
MAQDDLARSIATQALRATQGVGIPWTQPLVDNQPMGSFWVRVSVPIYNGPSATAIGHELGREPSGYIVVNNSTGAVIFATAADQAGWGPSVIRLRVSVPWGETVASLLIA